MNTTPKPSLLLLSLLLLGALGLAGAPQSLAASSAGKPGRKVAYYQDSMHPWIKSDQPGKCTICAMALTPVCEGEKGFAVSDNLVVLSTNSITVLNLRTDEVKRQPLHRSLRVAGTLEANETRKTIVSALARGRIDTVAVPFVGAEVELGQSLLTLYSPELVQQRRYLLTARAVTQAGGGTAPPVQLAKETDIYSSELLAPQAGVVVERNAYVGQYVQEGERLFTLVDASVLWFRFDVYERQLPWLEAGQAIDVVVPAIPGKVFSAVIAFLEPTVNDTTRTVKARADLPNPRVTINGHPQRLLRFGLYAEGRVRAEAPQVLAVPRSAILFPGDTAYAFVDKGDGAYERRAVQLGRQGDELWEIRQGLEEGDRVVTAGNVLIDAQAQFSRSLPSEPTPAPAMAAQAGVDGLGAPMESISPAMNTSANSPPAARLTPAQHQAVKEFLSVADGISRELAADSLERLQPLAGKLPAVTAPLVQALGADSVWKEIADRLKSTVPWAASTNLAAARRAFLPFSTAVVDLVQQLRGQEEAFRSLKVFHCPMAPQPGLWFQSAGPLRNPYFGEEMLTCGKEVQPPVAPRPAMASTAAPPVMAVSKPMTMPPPPARRMASTNQSYTHRRADAALLATSESMRKLRWAAIAEAQARNAAAKTASPTNESAPVPLPAPENPMPPIPTNAIAPPTIPPQPLPPGEVRSPSTPGLPLAPRDIPTNTIAPPLPPAGDNSPPAMPGLDPVPPPPPVDNSPPPIPDVTPAPPKPPAQTR